MPVINCIVWIIVGGLAGTITGRLVRGKGYGVVGDILLGLIGSLIGGFLFSLLGIGANNIFGSIAVSVIGAVLFVIVMRSFISSSFAK